MGKLTLQFLVTRRSLYDNEQIQCQSMESFYSLANQNSKNTQLGNKHVVHIWINILLLMSLKGQFGDS